MIGVCASVDEDGPQMYLACTINASAPSKGVHLHEGIDRVEVVDFLAGMFSENAGVSPAEAFGTLDLS